MAGMNSRPINPTQVYTQDTQPTTTRDGVLWVDTSVSPPQTKTYDGQTATWEPVATSNVKVQNTAPSGPTDGMIWVDTSVTPPRTKVYDATNAVWDTQARKARVDAFRTDYDNHALDASAHHARPAAGVGLAEVAGAFDSEMGWQFDGKTTGTGVASITHTLTGSYDHVLAVASLTETSNTATDIQMQANGDTAANYRYRDNADTLTSASSVIGGISRLSAGVQRLVRIEATGRWTGSFTGENRAADTGGGNCWSFENSSVTSPLSSITFLRADGAAAMDGQVAVFGRDLQ